MSQYLRHDAAYVLSLHILQVFAPLLRDEEKRDAFDEVYEASKAAFEAFDIQSERERMRRCARVSKN